MGRKSLGITKKVSLTLTQDQWDIIEKQKNKSDFFRKILTPNMLSGETFTLNEAESILQELNCEKEFIQQFKEKAQKKSEQLNFDL